MAQSKGSNIAESVKAIAEPIAENFGVRVWDVRFLKEGAEWYLRIFIDKENGVNITDCENVSRAIDPILDEKDFISQNYILEVSSPGLERELVRDEHFEEYVGKDIKIRLIRPMEGLGKEFCGVLKAFDGVELTIEDYDGENQVTINKKDTAWVKADDLDI
ncbi:MAG: ribosome maturation factor RimP [Clostridia bacterium]|nr:ribosome maturation factor RimP [Clostridia bacterium]